jgi:ribonuclease-3
MNDEERRSALITFFKNAGIEPQSLDALEEALVHSSYSFENDLPFNNERLEFLGDALIGFFAADFLMEKFPEASEGDMSRWKSILVSRPALGRCAVNMGLGEIILLGRGEDLAGGRERHSLIGSALEAVVGSIYLSNGLNDARKFVELNVFAYYDEIIDNDELVDYKSALQEIVQKQWKSVPNYTVVHESGPDHLKNFIIKVEVEGRTLARGKGTRKKTAENDAARKALERLEDDLELNP